MLQATLPRSGGQARASRSALAFAPELTSGTDALVVLRSSDGAESAECPPASCGCTIPSTSTPTPATSNRAHRCCAMEHDFCQGIVFFAQTIGRSRSEFSCWCSQYFSAVITSLHEAHEAASSHHRGKAGLHWEGGASRHPWWGAHLASIASRNIFFFSQPMGWFSWEIQSMCAITFACMPMPL